MAMIFELLARFKLLLPTLSRVQVLLSSYSLAGHCLHHGLWHINWMGTCPNRCGNVASRGAHENLLNNFAKVGEMGLERLCSNRKEVFEGQIPCERWVSRNHAPLPPVPSGDLLHWDGVRQILRYKGICTLSTELNVLCRR